MPRGNDDVEPEIDARLDIVWLSGIKPFDLAPKLL